MGASQPAAAGHGVCAASCVLREKAADSHAHRLRLASRQPITSRLAPRRPLIGYSRGDLSIKPSRGKVPAAVSAPGLQQPPPSSPAVTSPPARPPSPAPVCTLYHPGARAKVLLAFCRVHRQPAPSPAWKDEPQRAGEEGGRGK